MATEAAITQLTTVLDTVVSTPIEELLENPGWGVLNFKNVEPELRVSIAFLKRVYHADLGQLPEQMVSGMLASATEISTAIESIKNFSVAQGDASGTQAAISNKIRSGMNTLLSGYTPVLTLLDFIEGKTDSRSVELERLIGETKKQSTDLLADMNKSAVDAAAALTATKSAAGKAGVGVFTDDFKGEAGDYDSNSKIWLGITGVLAVVTVLIAAFYVKIFEVPTGTDWVPLVHYTTSKIVVIGLFITATVWCGSLYKTSRHHQTINKHRANALKTFQAFVEATIEPTVKDAVLMETTRSIFAITPTGYVGGSGGVKDNSTIIEVMKNVASKEKDL